MNDTLSSLSVTYVLVDSLLPHPNNSRVHTKKQVRQIASSIRTFGFLNPVLIDQTNMIVAGHGRVAAARLLGMREVPTIRVETLSETEIRAYIIADNKLAENAGWDRSILAIELQHLLTIEDKFDIEVTGFEIPEVDLIIQESKQVLEQENPVDLTNQGPSVAQCGDLWALGKHRIFCGNSLHEETYKKLMGGRKAKAVFADPPYNVPINGHVTGNGAIHHREFMMASGEMSESQFVAFLTTAFALLAKSTDAGSVHYVCMDWRHQFEILSAGRSVYGSLLNLCVWVKNNGGLGSHYRSGHELIFVFKNGDAPHRNNIQLGRFGRNRINVWTYPNAQTLSKQGEEGNLLALHPTVKPVAMIADALLDSSARGDIVLDPFLGSGSTLVAAERVGRICHGIEWEPLYVDVAIRRWQALTGESAVHVSSGKRFDEMASDEGRRG